MFSLSLYQCHSDCVEDLLTVNDELNNVFLRYDRYQRMRAGRVSAQPQPAPTVCPVQPPMYTAEPASPTHVMLPPVYSPRAQVVAATGDVILQVITLFFIVVCQFVMKLFPEDL